MERAKRGENELSEAVAEDKALILMIQATTYTDRAAVRTDICGRQHPVYTTSATAEIAGRRHTRVNATFQGHARSNATVSIVMWFSI